MADDKDLTEKLREDAKNTPHSGTSVFTHVDDAGADIHLSTVHGANRHFHGESMPPKHQLAEVVLGPAPFGSPDPRTLGHQMVPLEDGPASAAELDEDFVQMQRANFAGSVDTEQLDELTKDELLEAAEQSGVDVNKSATKEEIKQAIVDKQSQGGNEGSEDSGNNEDGSNEETNKGQDENSKSYSGMNKAELLDEAKNRGLDVDETNSKAEITEALENADKDNDTNNG